MTGIIVSVEKTKLVPKTTCDTIEANGVLGGILVPVKNAVMDPSTEIVTLRFRYAGRPMIVTVEKLVDDE